MLLSRSIAMATSAAALAVFALPAAPATAAGCGTFTPCGEVHNRSGRTVTITTNWGTSDDERWRAARTLADGKNAGGGNVDIDGFYVNARCRVKAEIDGTIHADRTYWAYGPLWHKVASDETATLRSYTCE